MPERLLMGSVNVALIASRFDKILLFAFSKSKCTFIANLLIIEAPSDAIKMHLDLLNAYSNILSNLEAMRATFTDPIRSLSGINQYEQHLRDLKSVIVNISAYFEQKLK